MKKQFSGGKKARESKNTIYISKSQNARISPFLSASRCVATNIHHDVVSLYLSLISTYVYGSENAYTQKLVRVRTMFIKSNYMETSRNSIYRLH